jgi:hypothetical protein
MPKKKSVFAKGTTTAQNTPSLAPGAQKKQPVCLYFTQELNKRLDAAWLAERDAREYRGFKRSDLVAEAIEHYLDAKGL